MATRASSTHPVCRSSRGSTPTLGVSARDQLNVVGLITRPASSITDKRNGFVANTKDLSIYRRATQLKQMSSVTVPGLRAGELEQKNASYVKSFVKLNDLDNALEALDARSRLVELPEPLA